MGFEVFGLVDVDDRKTTPLGEPRIFVSLNSVAITGGLELDPIGPLPIGPVVAGIFPVTVGGGVLEAS